MGIGLLLLVALVLVVATFDWNTLRAPLARRIAAVTGRDTAIDGNLTVHPWSWNPTAEVDGLRLENPPWADRSTMFGAKRIIVSVSLPRLLIGQLVLPRLELIEPVINLQRDAKGRASWELGAHSGAPNHDKTPVKLPTIRRLTIDDGKLHVVDQIRKLTFTGSLTAGDQAGSQDGSALKIRCSGSLNFKPFRLEADGGPLNDLAPDKPYSFDARLTASDINLDTRVTVRKAFDLRGLDVRFVLSGDDLADVYYLTGLALPNTPKYRFAATVHVDGTTYRAEDLKGSLGTSDLTGKMQLDTSRDRPKLTGKLMSATLNLEDIAPTLGHRVPPANRLAAQTTSEGRPVAAAPPADAPAAQSAATAGAGRLLPDADLQVKRVRGMDADLTYRAQSLKASKFPMKDLNLHLVLDDGVLTIDPLSFGLDLGKFSGQVRIDARHDEPVSDVDMRIDGVNLSEFKPASLKESPLDGSLLGRFKFHGAGSSVHKFAAASDGNVSIVIPNGQINDALAELTGINVVKGLGLLLAKNEQKTGIRCGIVDFKDHGGRLDTTTVYVDTSTVLITGRGDIDLGAEDIRLALQGNPKHPSFVRLRTPIELGGTLLHPTVGVKAGNLAAQAGAAAALGALLTPAAAILAFVDPGLAKDKDCSTVLQQAGAGVADHPEVPSVGAVSPPLASATAGPR